MRPFLPLALALILSLGVSHHALAQTAFDDPSAGIGTSGGTLVAVEPAVDAGSLALGSNTQVIVRFRNEAAQAVTFGEINLYPTSNITATVSMNQCTAAPLQLGGECAIVLNIKALKSGPFRTEMLIQHSARSKLITAVVAGEVAASDSDKSGEILSDLQATPDTLDFGTLQASRPALRTVMLRNISEDAVTVSAITLDSPQKTGFAVNSTCKELAPGQTCLVSVEWAPLLAGPSNGFLVVNHTGTSKVTTIPVEGVYEPAAISEVTKYPSPMPGKGLLVSSDESLDFGSDLDSEAALTTTLVNSGDADLKLTAMTLSVPVPGLIVDPTGCTTGTVLKPTEACPLTLRWAPQPKAKLITDLRITHDGTRGIFVLPIRGSAAENVRAGGGLASSVTLPPTPSAAPLVAETTGSSNTTTDLPGSMGLTLDDINELNGALTGDIADVIDRASGTGPALRPGTRSFDPNEARLSAAANSLNSYVVTSHSINRAVVLGPNGSRIVTHGKPVVLAGESWTPAITPAGIDFNAGQTKNKDGTIKNEGKTVSLPFDAAITANQSLLTDNSFINSVDALDSSTSSGTDTATAAPTILPAAPAPAPDASVVVPEDDFGNREGTTGLPDIFDEPEPVLDAANP